MLVFWNCTVSITVYIFYIGMQKSQLKSEMPLLRLQPISIPSFFVHIV